MKKFIGLTLIASGLFVGLMSTGVTASAASSNSAAASALAATKVVTVYYQTESSPQWYRTADGYAGYLYYTGRSTSKGFEFRGTLIKGAIQPLMVVNSKSDI
ncbi:MULTISPECIES: hypothetical protein [Enterococcus]|uniref:hypothetical protein n=1 Tax=Enterococcus TaxID=1350 RepID=UPI0010F59C2F|nr:MULTISPECIES: hypothetical protein [Enterococcus]KAF1301738.1 hypothetical protein BAU16_07550 [Enterococcus sp. JM9B]